MGYPRSFQRFTIQAVLIETRQQRYGNLETKRAAFYSTKDVERFKRTWLDATVNFDASGERKTQCEKREWVWQAQPSLFSTRRIPSDFWQEHDIASRDVNRKGRGVEMGQHRPGSPAAAGELSSWIWSGRA